MARIPFVNNSGKRWVVDRAPSRTASRASKVQVSQLNGENAFTPLISNCNNDGKCSACAGKEKLANDDVSSMPPNSIENKAKEGSAAEEAGETEAEEKEEDKLANAGTSAGAQQGWITRKAGNDGGGINEPWTATDHVHPNGSVRVIDEDGGGKTVHTFTPNMIKHWSVNIGEGAPKSVLDHVMKHAKKYVESGMKFQHGGLSNSAELQGEVDKLFNSGTSEGVKKAWMTRKGGASPHDYPIKRLGHGAFEGSTPHGTDFHVRKENGLHTVDIFDSKQKNPDKAHLHTFQEDNEGAAIQAAHEWSQNWKAGKQKGGWSMVPPKGAMRADGTKYKNSAPDIYERCESYRLSNTLLPPALQQELDAQVKVDFVSNAGTSEGVKKSWETRKGHLAAWQKADSKSRLASRTNKAADHLIAANAHADAASKAAAGNDFESARLSRMRETFHLHRYNQLGKREGIIKNSAPFSSFFKKK